jgi:hypothetical protein
MSVIFSSFFKILTQIKSAFSLYIFSIYKLPVQIVLKIFLTDKLNSKDLISEKISA